MRKAIIRKDLSEAKSWLELGEVIGVPTETVYGLAGNALDQAAISKIFEVKQRPRTSPLIVHAADIDSAFRYATAVPLSAQKLAEAFWPGPLTLLLPKSHLMADSLTATLPRVGLRVPAHPLFHKLLSILSFPLAAPSANPFGFISPTTAEHVFAQLGAKIPYILDGGPSQVGVESTILGFDDQGKPEWYRLGGISLEALEEVAGWIKPAITHSPPQNTKNIPTADSIKKKTKVQAPNQSSPGNTSSHYAPTKPLLLGDLQELLIQFRESRVGVLSFKQSYRAENIERLEILSTKGNLEEAGRQLYAALRRLDSADITYILAERVPDQGLGRAINDRLNRALAERKKNPR